MFARIASSFRIGAGAGAGVGGAVTVPVGRVVIAGVEVTAASGRGESTTDGVTPTDVPPGSCRVAGAKLVGCDAELSEKPGPISAAGVLPCDGAVILDNGAAATNVGVEAGGPETGARLGTAPVTLAGFMTCGDGVALDDGVVAVNADVEAGGPETGARLGTAPVTLAGFMIWDDEVVPGEDVAAPNVGVETGGREKTGVRFGVAPVTLAGFITIVSRPDDGARTGSADGGI